MKKALLEVRNLKKSFPLRDSFFRRSTRFVSAVDGVSFQIDRGEIFGLVGMSGCGKTTCGKLLLRLLVPSSGEILFKEKDVAAFTGKGLLGFRRRVQMVFQDPYESLNPRMTVLSMVAEPLIAQRMGNTDQRRQKAVSILERVGLQPAGEFLFCYPHELSGGQRQRVAIARSLVVEPEFLVADEPVSMLDASIRVGIMNLLLELCEERNLSFLLITHDLAGARYLCDRLAIMYLGKVVEEGKTEDIITGALHPYTQALLAAVPRIGETKESRKIFPEKDLSRPKAMPTARPTAIPACRFYPHCPRRKDVCKDSPPALVEVSPGHRLACHSGF